MTKLFSYRMTHDSGFAPNPYGGILTLATCKPGIRRTKGKGDWVAGWTGKRLINERIKLGKSDEICMGNEGLVYLMKVKDIIPIEDYYSKFKSKIPTWNGKIKKQRQGDNIYKPCEKAESGYKQICSNNHCVCYKKLDLSGEKILVAKEFYYFGREAIPVADKFRIKIPTTQTCYGVLNPSENEDEFNKLLIWLEKKYKGGGKIGEPIDNCGDWLDVGDWNKKHCTCSKREDTCGKNCACQKLHPCT